MNRRQFLKSTSASVAGALIAGCTSSRSTAPIGKPLGANSDFRVAVIGFHGHGKSHIKAYKSMPGVRLVALCDVDDEVLQSQVDELAKSDIRVHTYRDLRELYDNKEIDAVSIATPNFWHALATVWACQAGKHVCVEKPVSHCIWEGRKMVEAARKYDRLVQADLDFRSRPSVAAAFDFLRAGQIGKIVYVRALDYKRRDSMGKVTGPQQIPASVDYDLWTGPTPMRPLMRRNFHYDWHWQWNTGNGEIANNGAHHLDQVRWALDTNRLPDTVMSFGGRFGYVDDGETPNTMVAVYDYAGIPVIYEVRGLPEKSGSTNMDSFIGEIANGKPVNLAHNEPGPNGGIVVFCEGGYYHDGIAYDNAGKQIQNFASKGADVQPQKSFIAALRSGKIADLKTDIEQGHLSAAFCHMGNVSYACGRSISFNEAKQQLPANTHAAKALARMVDHLAANGVDTARTPLTVGSTLMMDSSAERFTGDGSERANPFLRDTYREPFVIRDRV